ncbi:hypothetical protein JVU11DRAFT_3949 [Chiua virens]|nr:hypothetical protein JVU11DRAFT_3949 [Chiua virens]
MGDEALLEDPGVLGILDKLVAIQAKVFASGSESECSKTSSFSKQVIKADQETFEAERGKGAARNVVECCFGE